jgi:hypothetical protein
MTFHSAAIPLAQMFEGQESDWIGLSLAIGSVVVAGAFIAWGMLVQDRARKSKKPRVLLAVIIATVFISGWLAASIHLYRTRSLDQMEAIEIVEQLPEIQAYEAAQPSRKIRTAVAAKSSNMGWEIDAVEYDEAQVKSTWHRFFVTSPNAEVFVIDDSVDQQLIPLSEWRASQSSTRP